MSADRVMHVHVVVLFVCFSVHLPSSCMCNLTETNDVMNHDHELLDTWSVLQMRERAPGDMQIADKMDTGRCSKRVGRFVT